ncbi:Flavodoxin [Anaerocolumna jejuensis DSM 15929]|uniref:Flavodoxin n=1 Tax=Anaerocolumna jejuensis DSM 15929 TaxID=1121322 RepID=A0A1M6QYS9_9FIRM|nr:flavodoxin family protein [Anaerocolumna jejuensis]SHK25364.1 Flavodoxin [Anaerocolumna jejuensis DSM 15929]
MMSEAKYAVRYCSKTGNTKKLAEQIAATLGCKAETVDHSIQSKADILFLGCSVYWGGIDPVIKNFIQNLDAKYVKKIVVFSTSALAERAYPGIQRLLKEKEICVSEDNFYCRGEFKFLHKGKPDAQDLKDVSIFARKFLEE